MFATFHCEVRWSSGPWSLVLWNMFFVCRVLARDWCFREVDMAWLGWHCLKLHPLMSGPPACGTQPCPLASAITQPPPPLKPPGVLVLWLRAVFLHTENQGSGRAWEEALRRPSPFVSFSFYFPSLCLSALQINVRSTGSPPSQGWVRPSQEQDTQSGSLRQAAGIQLHEPGLLQQEAGTEANPVWGVGSPNGVLPNVPYTQTRTSKSLCF